MLLPPPPEPQSLGDLASHQISGETLFRVWRAGVPIERPEPWWFSSQAGPTGGRFDLSAPLGTFYTSTSRAGALLEGLQSHLVNLPVEELEVRRMAAITVPEAAPPAADLCDATLAAHGVTAAVWAGADRDLTQSWAAALRRDGWWSIHAGVQHDPSGKSRIVALFGTEGAVPPTLGGSWEFTDGSIHDNSGLIAELANYGVAVRGSADLPFDVDPPT